MGRRAAITTQFPGLRPSPGTPPLRASPHQNVITRTSLFPSPGPARERKEWYKKLTRDGSWHRSLSLGSLVPESLSRHCEHLGALVRKAFHVIVSTGSLGVQSFSRHPELLPALAFKASYAADSHKHIFSATWSLGSLGVKALPVTGPSGGGSLGVKAVSVTVPSWGPRAHTTVRAQEPWC